MSAYTEFPVKEFKDINLLIAALKALGYNPVCTGQPMPLVGYQGDYRTIDGEGHTRHTKDAMHADVIIPRSQVGGASNDIGFKRNSSGHFTAILSDYDQSCGFNQTWLKKLTGEYLEAGVIREAKKHGLRQIGRKEENGKCVLLFQ
jgi:hypothetical protein